MKLTFVKIAFIAILNGCAVRPVPMGVSYVGPTYTMPGPGYAWQYHPRFGWGWHHPNNGWHRGWR